MNTTAFSLSDRGPLELLAPWVFDWSHFALYALVVFGITYVLGYSLITKPIREQLLRLGRPGVWVLDFLECPKCLGFHIGWIAVLMHVSPFESIGHGATLVGAFVTAALMLIADRFDFFDHADRRQRKDQLDQSDLEKNALEAERDRRRSSEMESVLAMQKQILDEGVRASARAAVATAFPREPGEPV